MSVYYADDQITLHHGKSLDVLRGMPDQSVNCCVTSPPYYGLRDYGVEGQYGLEKTPAEYVENMRTLFAEVRRVLAADGTLWLNLGDSYSSRVAIRPSSHQDGLFPNRPELRKSWRRDREAGLTRMPADNGLPEKNLLGMPWRVAFALQDDGWILRNAIIWNKPNAMPESVTDRLSNRYEHLFLFSRSRRYWFDLDAIRESQESLGQKHDGRSNGSGEGWPNPWTATSRSLHPLGKNPGDVWTIPTTPFPGAHFAVMPVELARRSIMAGCAPRVCRECGHKPEPTKKRGGMDMDRPQARRAMEIATEHGLTEEHFAAIRSAGATDAGKAAVTQSGTGKNTARVTELAGEAKRVLKGYYREFLLDRLVTDGMSDCGHGAYEPSIVLDPFSGSGTTGLAANQLGHRYIGIDLNADYLRDSLTTRFRQGSLIVGEPA